MNDDRPTWTTEWRKLRDLKPQPDNPRQIRSEQAERLQTSWDDYGQVETLAVGPDGDIYNGHQRFYVLRDKHGPDYEVDCRVSSRPLTHKEWQRLTVLLHQGTVGQWDFDELANWDVEIEELTDWGFSLEELGLYGWGDEDVPRDPGAQVSRADELQEKWGVKRGDLWAIGDHRLMCGDSTVAGDVARLMGGEEAVLCHADPPYGINASNMTMGSAQSSKPREARLSHGQAWDNRRPDILWLLKAAKWVCIWGGNYFADVLPVTNDWLCWHKKNDGLSFSEFELAWTNYGAQSRHIAHHWGAETKEHITQKPLAVLKWAIEKCPAKEGLIFDPFLGSGTTMVAVQQLGRRCFGMEIYPPYVSVALERLSVMSLEPRLLAP